MTTNDCIILYVEDDEDIAELNIRWFDEQGYEMVYARTGAEAIGAFGKVAPDIVLLDIMLPGKDGLTILKELRENQENKNIPVIMMTAKTSEFDIVRGLDLGADDYVTKPFGIMELLSRIRSVMRRSCRGTEKESSVLSFGSITVDCRQHVVTENGREVQLTLKEYELLCYMILNKGIVLSRDQIMQAVWGSPFEMESRTIDMHIMSLRQKLGAAGAMIRTVRGVGYRLGEK